MKLAPNFDIMLEVFTNNDICEHESIKAKDEWISIFKINKSIDFGLLILYNKKADLPA